MISLTISLTISIHLIFSMNEQSNVLEGRQVFPLSDNPTWCNSTILGRKLRISMSLITQSMVAAYVTCKWYSIIIVYVSNRQVELLYSFIANDYTIMYQEGSADLIYSQADCTLHFIIPTPCCKSILQC